jgi:hypothetical protein
MIIPSQSIRNFAHRSPIGGPFRLGQLLQRSHDANGDLGFVELRVDPPDQHAQLGVDLRPPSQWARLPTPVAAKAGPVPTHERLGPDDGQDRQD